MPAAYRSSKADPMLLFDGFSLRRGDRPFENVAEGAGVLI
jgi:hypothetical protein